MAHFGDIIIHNVKDMSPEFGLELDNIELEDTDMCSEYSIYKENQEIHYRYSEEIENAMIYGSEEEVPEGSIDKYILSLLQQNQGVSIGR